MPKPLIKSDDERKLMLVAAAGIALHALLSNKPPSQLATGLVREAFEVAEAFIAEAERRTA
jgi:hypothetical protein